MPTATSQRIGFAMRYIFDRPRRFRAIVIAVVFQLATISLAAAPAVRFEARAIVVERLSHGTTVAWFGLAHEPQAYHMRVREYAGTVSDEDRDGVVRIELPRDISPGSLWVVADTTSGLLTVAQPSETTIRMKPLPPPVLRRGTASAAQIEKDDEYLKFWLVRKGRGAWVHTAEDGGPGDSDGQPDGVTRARLSDFRPVANSPAPPADLERGDIVIVIDPWQLRLFETSVRDEDLKP